MIKKFHKRVEVALMPLWGYTSCQIVYETKMQIGDYEVDCDSAAFPSQYS